MSSPRFEVIANAATSNLVMVEGASLSSTMTFTDLDTGAAIRLSGSRVDLLLYSGLGGPLLTSFSSSGSGAAITVEPGGTDGAIEFHKAVPGIPVGTWPYVLLATDGDGICEPLLDPALFKVLARNGGQP